MSKEIYVIAGTISGCTDAYGAFDDSLVFVARFKSKAEAEEALDIAREHYDSRNVSHDLEVRALEEKTISEFISDLDDEDECFDDEDDGYC